MKHLFFRPTVFFITLSLGLFTAWIFFDSALTSGVPEENGIPEVVLIEPPAMSSDDKPNSSEAYIEAFSDDSLIGRPRKNKVEIRCSERGDRILAEIRFYSRKKDEAWVQKQSFGFEEYGSFGCYPEVRDFNNDGLKDFTYKSGVAARGANEIRTLFIYNKKTDELVHIKNSPEYPNLAYNKKLNCLDAWLFHGATTTVFLKLEGDMLKRFASVDTGLERVVTVIQKNGTERVVSRKKMHEDDIYTRYSSFDPPRP